MQKMYDKNQKFLGFQSKRVENPVSTSQKSVRTAATSEALQLQGGRGQKTSTVGESEKKEFLKHSIL